MKNVLKAEEHGEQREPEISVLLRSWERCLLYQDWSASRKDEQWMETDLDAAGKGSICSLRPTFISSEVFQGHLEKIMW